MNKTLLDVTYGEKDFAYNLEIKKETSTSIFATGIYGDIYRLNKKNKKLFINKEFAGMVNKYNCF